MSIWLPHNCYVTQASGPVGVDYGFNFRAGSGYVTDGANETYVLANNANYDYPSQSLRDQLGDQSLNAGYSDRAVQARDRNNSVDRRLAGFNGEFANTPGTFAFRIDVPTTSPTKVSLGLTDVVTSTHVANFRIWDGPVTTGVLVVDFTGTAVTASTQVQAADKVERSNADWVTAHNSDTPKLIRTFSQYVTVSGSHPTSGAVHAALAHIRVEA